MAPASEPPAGTPPAALTAAVELVGIDKRFGAVHANRQVSLRIERGSIHGIVGENGAGKSTLMSILYGYYQADAGEIRIDGRPVAIRSAQDAIAAGIGMVHQHFMLVDDFTVLENVVLGAERGPILARGLAEARRALAALGRDYGLAVEPDALVRDLPVGLQQRVEILKALHRGARVLILDEPTGVLTPQEADQLFAMLRTLRDQGRTVILITHKLREIMAVTDRVTVMRAGGLVETVATRDTSRAALAEAMVGRKVALRLEKAAVAPGPVVLEVERLSIVDAAGIERVQEVSFAVRGGEIVGIAGVTGNGQTELLEALAGMRRPTGGTIRLNGRTLPPAQGSAGARAMRRRHVAHVPEDRQRQGLIGRFLAWESMILGYHDMPEAGRHGLLDRPGLIARCAAAMEAHDVRPRDPLLRTAAFSGGNQQKMVLAREIDRAPELLLVGQPTRGVDIGAIEFIHRRLLALRAAGKALLLVSVELEEILALADRILVMCQGRIVGELPRAEATEARLGLMMAGIEATA